MLPFLVILAADLISENAAIPWYVHGLVLAAASADFIWKRFDKKPEPELPDEFWADLQESYEKRNPRF